MAYMEKTGIYQKLRDVLYDVYYGKKFPNPLPRICNKIEDFNRKYSDVILSKNVIEQELYRPDTRIEEAEFAGKKVKDYYWASKQFESNLSQPGRYRPQLEADVQHLGHDKELATAEPRYYSVLYGRV